MSSTDSLTTVINVVDNAENPTIQITVDSNGVHIAQLTQGTNVSLGANGLTYTSAGIPVGTDWNSVQTATVNAVSLTPSVIPGTTTVANTLSFNSGSSQIANLNNMSGGLKFENAVFEYTIENNPYLPFNPITNPFPDGNSQLNYAFCSSDGQVILLCGIGASRSGGGISTDGGATWLSPYTTPALASMFINTGCISDDAQTVITVAQYYPEIYWSIDGGLTATNDTTVFTTYPDRCQLSYISNDKQHAFLFGDSYDGGTSGAPFNPLFYNSSDNCASWQLIGAGLPRFYQVISTNVSNNTGQYIIVAGWGGGGAQHANPDYDLTNLVYIISDYGATFTPVNAPWNTVNFYSVNVMVSPTGQFMTVLIGEHLNPTPYHGSYVSTNFGQTWTTVSGTGLEGLDTGFGNNFPMYISLTGQYQQSLMQSSNTAPYFGYITSEDSGQSWSWTGGNPTGVPGDILNFCNSDDFTTQYILAANAGTPPHYPNALYKGSIPSQLSISGLATAPDPVYVP